jgi:hypothetical protein
MIVKLPGAFRHAPAQLSAAHDSTLDWWRRTVLHQGGTDPLEDLHDACARFRATMGLHIRTRTFLQGVQGGLTALADRAERPDLAIMLLGGFER